LLLRPNRHEHFEPLRIRQHALQRCSPLFGARRQHHVPARAHEWRQGSALKAGLSVEFREDDGTLRRWLALSIFPAGWYAAEGLSGTSTMTFERLLDLPATWSCASGRFGVHLFQGHLSISDIDRLEMVGAEWHRQNPEKTVELVVVLPSSARMSSEERQRMVQVIRRWERKRIASATVILAEGLSGAVQRSILTGIMMLAPSPHPAKVFGTLEDAVAFLEPSLRTLQLPFVTGNEALCAVRELYDAFRTRCRSIGVEPSV
jgi:hypothetical protein